MLLQSKRIHNKGRTADTPFDDDVWVCLVEHVTLSVFRVIWNQGEDALLEE